MFVVLTPNSAPARAWIDRNLRRDDPAKYSDGAIEFDARHADARSARIVTDGLTMPR
jgi:hypothetical protein